MNTSKYKVLENTGIAKIKPVKAWINGVLFEDGARKQLEYMASMPYVFKHIAVMPDVHAGIGSCVGTVIPCIGAISPASVGVDIGCGMRAARTSLKGSDINQPAREAIFVKLTSAVPNGRTDNGGPGDRGAWGYVPENVHLRWTEQLEDTYLGLIEDNPILIGKNQNAAEHQLGTLGTGNHFCEISVDENDDVWVVVHTGSRGPGAKIGSVFTEIAKREMSRWLIELPDSNLAYLPVSTEEFAQYRNATLWAQDYARINRELITESALKVLRKELGPFETFEQIDCKHNYLELENHFGTNVWVVRKGAIRARKNDWGIIPGSMGAKSYIVKGLGNPDSFTSCSHGAGRKMSRTAARNTFTTKDHEKATEGVVCLKDKSVIDETPGSYKDIDAVMEAQSDLVEIHHTLKQIISVKGAESEKSKRGR